MFSFKFHYLKKKKKQTNTNIANLFGKKKKQKIVNVIL